MTSKVSPTIDNNVENKYMNGIDNSFMENERGQKLHCRYWNPPLSEPTRALVFISHGFAEHLEWYEELAEKFSSIGILAFGHDHVGHGNSEGVRGHISSTDDYASDVLLHCEKTIKKYKGLPCFIVGHSMGGMITILSAMKKPELFAGVVLMGPLIRPNPDDATPFKICAAKVIAKIFPYCPVAWLNLKYVTRDTAFIEKMQEDPFRYQGGVRAQWSVACLETLTEFCRHFEQVKWPFLILHGEKDLLCEPGAATEFYRIASSKDKEIKIFPDAYHHLYLELPEVKRQALQDTVDWVKARL